MKAYERVTNARNGKRKMGGYYIDTIFNDFLELHGDRRYGDDKAIKSGIATIGGKTVTVIAMERGETIQERMQRNFGCPSPEGYRKALRLMKQAEKFNRPVICFIGSSGAFCGISAEERGQGQAIAENLMEMSSLKVPVISVVVGEGGSGGALALGVANSVIMFENAVYSVISPEGCASILWKDSSKAAEAAEALKITASNLKEFGVIDEIVEEDGKTDEEICNNLKKIIMEELEYLSKYNSAEIAEHRYNKFRKIGA